MPEKIITQTQILNTVADQMITDKGLDLSDDERKSLRNELRKQIEDRIESDMLNALSDDELMRLNELLERDASDDEVDEFFRGLTINFDEVARKSMAKFRGEYLSGELEEQDVE